MQNQMLKKLLTTSVIAAMVCFFNPSEALAQRAAGDVGIGVQIGQPSGLALKVYRPQGMSPDFLLAWDLDDFFFLNVHGLWQSHIGNSQNFHFFYGPGAFIGIRDHGQDELDNDILLGISGNIGLGVLIHKFEIYGQVTPRLQLIESTDGDIGGGIGFRYYF